MLKQYAEQASLLLIIQNSKLPNAEIGDHYTLYKSGDGQNPLNHKPASQTSATCKLLEMMIIIKTKTKSRPMWGTSNKLYGSRGADSCAANLSCFYERDAEILKVKWESWVDCVYFF